MADLRREVIDRVLRHIANDFLRRAARSAPTDHAAAASLRMHINGGAYLGHLNWCATPKGIAYGGPAMGAVTGERCDGVIPWLELARAARSDSEQLTMEVTP